MENYKITDNGAQALCSAILRSAVTDYQDGVTARIKKVHSKDAEENLQSATMFFNSDFYKLVVSLFVDAVPGLTEDGGSTMKLLDSLIEKRIQKETARILKSCVKGQRVQMGKINSPGLSYLSQRFGTVLGCEGGRAYIQFDKGPVEAVDPICDRIVFITPRRLESARNKIINYGFCPKCIEGAKDFELIKLAGRL